MVFAGRGSLEIEEASVLAICGLVLFEEHALLPTPTMGTLAVSPQRLAQHVFHSPRLDRLHLTPHSAQRSRAEQQKGRSPKRAPLFMRLWQKKQGYIFFSEHAFFAASHVPPAFSQSAAFFAVVTSPAKAGPVKASANASAKVDTSVFMDVTPYDCGGGCRENSAPTPRFRANLLPLRRAFPRNLDRHCSVSVSERGGGVIATMSHLFAAILFSSPGCPHEEPRV